MECNLCKSRRLEPLGCVGVAPVSVTSDFRFVMHQPTLYLCSDCHHLQKSHTGAELRRIEEIYKDYRIHALTGGGERLVFGGDGPPVPRTHYALARCRADLPPRGRLLDVGTGTGTVLKAASELLPDWELSAFDVTDRCREKILKIPRVTRFFTGKIEDLGDARFDCIVLWQTLEHMMKPTVVLSRLKEHLTPRGYFLIQVPDFERGPFDLGVMDHRSHFTKLRLLRLIEATGLELVRDGESWSHNNITLLLRRRSTAAPTPVHGHTNGRLSLKSYVDWTYHVIEHFEKATRGEDFAVFGTGFSSHWVFSQLTRKPVLFVDMDERALGHDIQGIPIRTPESLAPDVRLVMPFTHETGKRISGIVKRRYAYCENTPFIFSPPLVTAN